MTINFPNVVCEAVVMDESTGEEYQVHGKVSDELQQVLIRVPFPAMSLFPLPGAAYGCEAADGGVENAKPASDELTHASKNVTEAFPYETCSHVVKA